MSHYIAMVTGISHHKMLCTSYVCNVDPFLITTQHMKTYKLWCMHYMRGTVFSEVSGYKSICALRHSSFKMYVAEIKHVHVHTNIK